MDESGVHYVKENVGHRKTNTAPSHLNIESKKSDPREVESRIVVSSNLGE